MQLPYKRRIPLLAMDGMDMPPQPVGSEEFMAVFDVYADDSGKFENLKDDYTSLCGYIGHFSEWVRFGMEWQNARLRWQVPPVHMSAIMFPERDQEWQKKKDEWGRTWEKKRDVMLNDFAKVILSAQIVCVGAVVDIAHYRSLPDSEFKKGTKDALVLAFHQVVMRGIEKTEIIDSSSSISFVIDDDRGSSVKYYEMLHGMKEVFTKVKNRVHGISFVNDKSYPGIQAADMIAYEGRRLMVERKKNPNAEPSGLYADLTLLGIHQPLLYTPQVLDLLNSMPYDGSTSDQTKQLRRGEVRRNGAENIDGLTRGATEAREGMEAKEKEKAG